MPGRGPALHLLLRNRAAHQLLALLLLVYHQMPQPLFLRFQVVSLDLFGEEIVKLDLILLLYRHFLLARVLLAADAG